LFHSILKQKYFISGRIVSVLIFPKKKSGVKMKNLVKIFLICTVGFLAACSNQNTTLPRLSETELDQKSYAIAYSVTGQTYKDRVTKDYNIPQFTQGVTNWYYNRVPMPIEQIQALTINRLVDHKEYAYNSGVIFADAFQQKVNYLLLSGDNRTLQYNEPRAMFRDLRKMGVSEASMFRDFAGFRTLDSVIRADKIFQVQAFTIVSQKFHCERALLIAKAHDIDAICFVAKQPELPLSTRIREVFARIKAVLDLILDVEPYFLGEPEPLPSPINKVN